MQVDFYGRLAELHGSRHLSDAPDGLANGVALRAWLAETHPPLADVLAHAGTRLVVDSAIVDWDAPLAGADDIAIIPVVSGG